MIMITRRRKSKRNKSDIHLDFARLKKKETWIFTQRKKKRRRRRAKRSQKGEEKRKNIY